MPSMKMPYRLRAGAIAMGVLFGALAIAAWPRALGETPFDERCTWTAKMQVYSSANLDDDSGDVTGYELAIDPAASSSVQGQLYIYQGEPNTNGVRLTGTVAGKNTTLSGKWVQPLVEYPSRRTSVERHDVTIAGTFDARMFRGTVTIDGKTPADKLSLKRVKNIWLCER